MLGETIAARAVVLGDSMFDSYRGCFVFLGYEIASFISVYIAIKTINRSAITGSLWECHFVKKGIERARL